jgi:hypothetical protein
MADFLEPYKPQVSISQTFQVDETLPDNELVFTVLQKLILARKTQDLVYLSIGHMLQLVRDRKLYKHLDFETFEDFLGSEELSMSREKAYMTIRIYEHYVEYLKLSEETMKDFSIVRLSLMLPSLKKIESKEEQIKEIERMKSLRYNDFVREIKEKANKGGQPNVYWSEEASKWIVQYYENVTALIPLGEFIEGEVDAEK